MGKFKLLCRAIREPLGVVSLIYLIAFAIVYILHQLHCLEPNVATTLMAVLLTAFSSALLVSIRDAYYRGELKVLGIDSQRFENSIRIIVEVRNVGRAVAKYVKPLLTIDEESLAQLVFAEKTKFNERWTPCSKDGYSCPICAENVRGFLCPEPFNVNGEYLCWAVAEVGAGSDFGRYYHVTNIPPSDTQRVVVADIYKDDERELSVVKFFSEYGTEGKPRICYKLSLGRKASIATTIRFVGEGFDPIEEELWFEIAKDELKVMLDDYKPISISEFKEIKEFPINFTPAPVF